MILMVILDVGLSLKNISLFSIEKRNGNIRKCKNECCGNVSYVNFNPADLVCIRNSNLNRKIKNRLDSCIEWNPLG